MPSMTTVRLWLLPVKPVELLARVPWRFIP
jgi:hypothetical protein